MATKKELTKRCEELGIDTKPLTTNALLEEAIKAKEAELAAEETQKASEATQDQPAETSEKTEEDTTEATSDASEATSEEDPSEEKEETEEVPVPSYEDDRGRKWRFKDSAPKTLNIDGHPMTQQEILETEEVVSELVYGNSAHLTQILD